MILKKEDAISKLNVAYQVLLNTTNGLSSENFYLDDNVELGQGSCAFDNYGQVKHCYVGIKELVEKPDDSDISNFEFMLPFVGMFHEVCGHVYQYRYEYMKDTSLAKILCMNSLASAVAKGRTDDSVSIFGKGSYWHQINEIAAQYAGIKNAYEYLKMDMPDKAESLICEYVNTRIKNHSEFIDFKNGKPYKNVDDILFAFNDKFNKEVYKHRHVDLTATYADPTLPLSVYMAVKHGTKGKEDLWIKFELNGVSQDKMLTYIYLREEDSNEYLQQRFRESLSDILNENGCLDYECAFPLSCRINHFKDRDSFDLNELDTLNNKTPLPDGGSQKGNVDKKSKHNGKQNFEDKSSDDSFVMTDINGNLVSEENRQKLIKDLENLQNSKSKRSDIVDDEPDLKSEDQDSGNGDGIGIV